MQNTTHREGKLAATLFALFFALIVMLFSLTQCAPSDGGSDESACSHVYGEDVKEKIGTADACAVVKINCTLCGAEKIVEKVSHNYIATVTGASCAIEGRVDYACSECGHAYQERLELTPAHSWNEGEPLLQENACGSFVARFFKCTVCSAVRTETVSEEHSFGEWQWGKDPSDSTKGCLYRVCKSCGFNNSVPTEGHSCATDASSISSEVVIDTCVDGRVTRFTCATCGWEQHVRSKDGKHGTWGEVYTFIDATDCTEQIHQIKKTCMDCGCVEYSYPVAPTFEHNYAPSIGLGRIDLYLSHAYNPNPDPKGVNWMVVRTNVKYDADGFITSFDVHWHDKDKNCQVTHINVAEVRQMLIDWGFTFEEGKPCGVEIAIYDGYYVPRGQFKLD